jgi:hypothetical protein
MHIRVTCESCGTTLKAAGELAGKCGCCPRCHNILAIPGVPVFSRPSQPAGSPAMGRSRGPTGVLARAKAGSPWKGPRAAAA